MIEDELDDAERSRLHAAIARGIEQSRRGESVAPEPFLAELRTARDAAVRRGLADHRAGRTVSGASVLRSLKRSRSASR